MRRRELIAGIVGAVTSSVLPASAQTLPKIGFLHSGSSGPNANVLAQFRQGLGETGFIDGQNVSMVFRWADDRFDHLHALTAELVKARCSAILVGGGDVTALAAKSVTNTIPIVFAIGADPVEQGIVPNLNRPGGNITGATFLAVQLRPKLIELLREVLPGIHKIGVLANPNRPNFQRLVGDVLKPAEAAGLIVRVLRARNEHEIEAAITSLAGDRVEGLLVLSDPVYTNRRERLAALLKASKIPALHGAREIVRAGGLMSYAAPAEDAYRQAGAYVGRILKGEAPGQLPVVQPTRFELVINLRTAQALGITIPPTLIARADEVIE